MKPSPLKNKIIKEMLLTKKEQAILELTALNIWSFEEIKKKWEQLEEDLKEAKDVK